MNTFLKLIHLILTILIGIYVLFYTYSKNQLDMYANSVRQELYEIKKKVFPEAYKLAEKENCNVDIKTMKCIGKNE